MKNINILLMPMVIKKAMTNNPMYIVKESHTFP